jgi:hypothetical protein
VLASTPAVLASTRKPPEQRDLAHAHGTPEGSAETRTRGGLLVS